MMGDLRDLRKALRSMSAVSYRETVRVGGMEFVLRALSAAEGIRVASMVENLGSSRQMAQQIRTMQIGTLACVIERIDQMDLSESEIQTGELGKDGLPLVQDKVEALCEMLEGMLPEYVDALYEQYERLDRSISKQIERSPVDLQSDIRYHEQQIARLKAHLAQHSDSLRESDPSIEHVEKSVVAIREGRVPGKTTPTPVVNRAQPPRTVRQQPSPPPEEDEVLYDVELPDLEMSSFGTPVVRVQGLTEG